MVAKNQVCTTLYTLEMIRIYFSVYPYWPTSIMLSPTCKQPLSTDLCLVPLVGVTFCMHPYSQYPVPIFCLGRVREGANKKYTANNKAEDNPCHVLTFPNISCIFFLCPHPLHYPKHTNRCLRHWHTFWTMIDSCFFVDSSLVAKTESKNHQPSLCW